MKRFILPVLLSATTALASPIVGTWHCVGSDENIRSDTKVEYLQDGSFRGDAKVKVDDNGNVLAYHVVGSGKWRFANNTLNPKPNQIQRSFTTTQPCNAGMVGRVGKRPILRKHDVRRIGLADKQARKR